MTTQEREAWATAYRLYDEYAPALRQAATLNDDNEMAGRLFLAALDKLKTHFTSDDDDSNWILLSAFDTLDNVFKAAQKRKQAPAEKSA